MLALGIAVAVAFYAPTTLVDYDADLAAGDDTLATRFGYQQAYRLGLVAWAGANASVVVLSALDVVIPREMLPVLFLAAPVLVAAYSLLIGRARESVELVRGIIVVSWLFLVPSVIFALMYTGLWAPSW
jgi:chlorophyll synthase